MAVHKFFLSKKKKLEMQRSEQARNLREIKRQLESLVQKIDAVKIRQNRIIEDGAELSGAQAEINRIAYQEAAGMEKLLRIQFHQLMKVSQAAMVIDSIDERQTFQKQMEQFCNHFDPMQASARLDEIRAKTEMLQEKLDAIITAGEECASSHDYSCSGNDDYAKLISEAQLAKRLAQEEQGEPLTTPLVLPG